MVLEYSQLEFDLFGRPEKPELMLQTLSGEAIGLLPNVSNIKLNVKFSEPSEITFDIKKPAGDTENALYEAVTGYKLIYTKQYGIYVILNPDTTSDGISEVKSVKGYSLKKVLDTKKIFIEEGTFNFWNPVDSGNTIMGRILEIATGWSVGYIHPNLIGKYRTFDSYDDYLMSYVYKTLPEKFRCVFVFDSYNKTISVYDADEDRATIPVYLDFDNLIQEVKVEEMTDEMVTALSPYGADDLDIRTINPIGTNWVYDLSYFIANGDINATLAAKWEAWQRSILTNQPYYNGLIALRASATAQLFTLQAALTDLNGELDDYYTQQSVTIQQQALETSDAGIASQQALLNTINANIAAKKIEISKKEAEITVVENSLDSSNSSSYSGKILALVNQLAFTQNFTTAEQEALSVYFIEQTVTETTFVATDVTSEVTGTSNSISSGTLFISGSKVYEISFVTDLGKRMFTAEGGTFSLTGTTAVSGDVIRATVEVSTSGSYVASLYLGSVTTGGTTASSGVLTLTGTAGTVSSDISATTEDGVSLNLGSWLRFSLSSTTMYLTTSVNDYQKYAVQMELFDFAVEMLDDLSSPTYEFSVSSANLIFSQQFEPFRKELELGKSVYLSLGNHTVITPIMIEYQLDFEDSSKFSILFSNRFKRHDMVNSLKDMIENSYSSSRSFDASQYIYSQAVGQTSAVTDFLNNSLDAAKNTILAAANQSVVINSAGIQIGSNSNYQLRLIDSMIAMTDDNWSSAKLAIGRFASSEVGEYWGVNAEVIGGKLLAGNNLVIESEKADGGIANFRVDASGCSLHNATFDIYDGTGSRHITINPDCGIAIGTYPLYKTNSTTINEDNAGFWVDTDGNIYLKGTLKGCDGTFTGSLSAATGSFSGELNAATGTFAGELSAATGTFAGKLSAATGTFAGELSAATGTFSGDISAASGTFTGGIKASAYYDSSGNLMMNSGYQFTADYLSLLGINVGDGNFVVTSSGDVSIKGNITMGAGSTINWASVTESNLSSSSTYSAVTEVKETVAEMKIDVGSAAGAAEEAAKIAVKIANDTIFKSPFIKMFN